VAWKKCAERSCQIVPLLIFPMFRRKIDVSPQITMQYFFVLPYLTAKFPWRRPSQSSTQRSVVFQLRGRSLVGRYEVLWCNVKPCVEYSTVRTVYRLYKVREGSLPYLQYTANTRTGPLSFSPLSECRVSHISDYLPLLLHLSFPSAPPLPSLACLSIHDTSGRSMSPRPTLEIVPCIDFCGPDQTDSRRELVVLCPL
jgi:hypothetical protein